MPVANTGYLHLRGRKNCTLFAFRAGFSVFRQKSSRKSANAVSPLRYASF